MHIIKPIQKKAFSLIELAISLLVIGIIIAAVMTGGDIIKSGDSKQFYQSFARKWTVVIDGYYDRMGRELADADKDGYFDGSDVDIAAVTQSGINLSTAISTNQENPSEFSIKGEYTGYEIVKVKLYSYILNNSKYNYIVLSNIPSDIAVAVDRYIDGVSDGAKGNCVNLSATLPANGIDITTTVKSYDIANEPTTNIGFIIEH